MTRDGTHAVWLGPLTRLVALSVLMGSLCAPIAWPQAAKEANVIPQKSFIDVSTKKIPYKPIAQKDAKGRFIDSLSGKSYGPEDNIDVPKIDRPVSLKPGTIPVRVTQPATRMKAKDYYAQLEEIERYLSSKGYSLREEKSLGTLERYDAKYSRLEADAKKLRADSRRVTSIAPKATMLSIDRFLPHSGVVAGEYVEYTGSRSYNKEIGSPDAMSVWWRNSMEGVRDIDPDDPFTKFHAESSVGQTIFGYECVLAKVGVTSMLDKTGGSSTAYFEVAALPPSPLTIDIWAQKGAKIPGVPAGSTLYKFTGPSFEYKQTFFKMSVYVQAGPVPVTITIGVEGGGDLKINGSLSIEPIGYSSMTVTPSTFGNVFGSGQVGLRTAMAIGLGVNLTALKLSTPVTHTIRVTNAKSSEKGAVADPLDRKINSLWTIKAQATDILSGHIYLAITVLKIDFNIELFDWKGFSFDPTTLYHDSEELVPGFRKPDPALAGMSYIQDKGTISIDVVNWGGATDWKGYTLKVTNQDGKGALSIPLATINKKGELDSTVSGKEGRVSYTLSQKEMQRLKLPLNGSAKILGEIVIPSGGVDLHRDNNKFSITIRRSVDLVVSSLEYRPATKKPVAPEGFALSLANGTGDPVTWADLAVHLVSISFNVNGKTYTIRGADLLKESELATIVGGRTPILISFKSLGLSATALGSRAPAATSAPAPGAKSLPKAGTKSAPAPSATSKPAPGVKVGVLVRFNDANTKNNEGSFSVALK